MVGLDQSYNNVMVGLLIEEGVSNLCVGGREGEGENCPATPPVVITKENC